MGFILSPLTEFEKYKDDEILNFILEEFKKPPYENIFYIYSDFLSENSFEIDFKSEWNFNPWKASYEIYGNKEYFRIFFPVNNIPSSIFYFTNNYLQRLKFPPLDLILKLKTDAR